jgi:hypothetical protein
MILEKTHTPRFSTRPAQLHLRRLLGKPPHLSEVAERSYELHPAEPFNAPPAYFDASDMDRVVGYGTNRDRELRRIQGGPKTINPTVMYRLRDVQMLSGHLLFPNMIRRWEHRARRPWIATAEQFECNVGALANSKLGLRYFAHWLHDDLPMCLAVQDMGPLVSPQTGSFGHQAAYLAVTGLEITRCDSVRFKELYFVDDRHAENSHKKDRLLEVRKRLWTACPSPIHEGVFLVRGSGGQRRVLRNEMELAASLSERGIRVVDVATSSPQDVMRQCAHARVVIGVEGSQLNNGLISIADGRSMLVIQPPRRFNCHHKELCDILGVRYGFVVGESFDKSADFSVDTDSVHRLLDRLMALPTT